ncbi:hypothetical protein KO317_00230 [Candidatus Micrarchaeota archaeon]|nr:hypothetical protein [Candidatus Micrarchaeota archaeon]
MAKAKSMEKIGGYLFILGIILAVILGVMGSDPMLLALLVVFGIIVGILNISDKEIINFLIAAIALGIAGSALVGLSAILPGDIGAWILGIFSALVMFIGGAVIFPALKVIYDIAADN